MKFTILFIIFSIFGTVFDGGELCFSHKGDVHLSCCCKKEATLKKPCCGSKCTNISFPSLDVAVNQSRVIEDVHLETDKDHLSYLPTFSGIPQNIDLNLPSCDDHRFYGDRSHIFLKLSKTVLRC